MINTMVTVQLSIIITICCGCILRKENILNESSINTLSKLVNKLILPINIFCSCILSFSYEHIQDIITMVLLGILVEVILYIVMQKVPCHNMNTDRKNITQYALVISNGGLIGIPLINGLYGEYGVLLANMFLIATRILLQYLGNGIFGKKARNRHIKACICESAGIIAVILGMICSFCKISIPKFLFDPLNQISNCLSPLALLLVGGMLYRNIKISSKAEGIHILKLVIVKQCIIPVTVGICLWKMPISVECKMIAVLLMGMSLSSAVAMFAGEYGGDYLFASKAVAISTVTCAFTLLGVAWFAGILL